MGEIVIPIVIWFDGITIVYYYYLFNYVLHYFLFCFVWWPGMAINVSIKYNGGSLPDITGILLTQRCYHRGAHLDVVKRFCICSL